MILFELTVDLYARSTVVKETRVVIIAIPVDAVELRFWHALLRVIGRHLNSRFRFITWLRARLNGFDVVLGDKRSLVAIFYRRTVRRGLAILVQGRLLLAAVLQLGTADALVFVGECRIIRAGGIRHLSIASPKAAEPSPDNAHLVSVCHASRFCNQIARFMYHEFVVKLFRLLNL